MSGCLFTVLCLKILGVTHRTVDLDKYWTSKIQFMKSFTGKFCFMVALVFASSIAIAAEPASPRERISLNPGWRFVKGDPDDAADKLAYTNIQAWVEATGAEFTTNADLAARKKPEGNPGGGDITYAQNSFDDSQWRLLNLPHDWGIEG